MPGKTVSKSIAAKGPAQKGPRAKSATATPRKRTVKAVTTVKPQAKAAPKLSAAKKSTMTGRAVKRTRKTAPPAAPVAALDPTAFHEAVARLAYQLWEQRGHPDSSAEIDWFRAEEEIGRPSLGVKAFRAEHNATLRVDLTYEFSSWLIRITPTTSMHSWTAATRLAPGASSNNKHASCSCGSGSSRKMSCSWEPAASMTSRSANSSKQEPE